MRRFKDYGPGPAESGHRLVMYTTGRDIVVSCACLKGTVPGQPRWCPPLDTRRRWTAPEVSLVFAEHAVYPEASR